VLILAIDTCDAQGSVALVEEQRVLASARHETAEDYSTWLLPAVDGVLAAAGRELTDVAIYAAAAGPGSFTGIRIALTTVKAWNEVFRKPVAAVSRLEAFAIQAVGSTASAPPEIVAAYCDAQRGQLYGAVYRRKGGFHEPLGEERVVSPAELIGWAAEVAKNEPVAWVSPDPASLAGEPAWQERAADPATNPATNRATNWATRGEVLEQVPRLVAPAIARIAAQLAEQGRLTDALMLDANYIRRPDAEVKWKGYSKPVL
jgi:tRNA threonylcarbamoyl adenosine modification protein YeaZ